MGIKRKPAGKLTAEKETQLNQKTQAPTENKTTVKLTIKKKAQAPTHACKGSGKRQKICVREENAGDTEAVSLLPSHTHTCQLYGTVQCDEI